MTAPTVERGPAISRQATSMVPHTEESKALVPVGGQTYTRDQVELIKRTIAKGATDDELQLFIKTSERLGLDPFARQIFAIKRWDPDTRDYGMTTHVSIDGLRLSAERTRRYMPSEELYEFRYNAKSELVSVVAAVKKLGPDGQWHRVPAIAFFDEYAQTKKDGGLQKNWAEKPHVMLSKCAEALAIRRAFPLETAGVYIPEEMPDVIDAEYTEKPAEQVKAPPPPPPVVPRPAPSTSTAPQSSASRAGGEPAKVAPRAAEAAPISPPAAAKPGPSQAVPAAATPSPPPRAEVAAPPMDDIDPNFAGDPLPPAPAPKEADARGETSEVDELVAIAGTAATLAEMAAVGMRVAALSKDDKEWLAPFWVDGLIRVLDTGPEADVERVFAELAKYRKAKKVSAAQEQKAAAIYQARTAK